MRTWIAILLALLPGLLWGQIKIDPQYDEHKPIVAEYLATVPPGAQIQTTWSLESPASALGVGNTRLHIWAPPGEYDISIAGMWVSTKEITYEGETLQVLLGFGFISDQTTFKVGEVEPPVPPGPVNPYEAPSAHLLRLMEPVSSVRMEPVDSTRLAEMYAMTATKVAAGAFSSTSSLRAHLVAAGKELAIKGKYAGLADAVDSALQQELGKDVRDTEQADADFFKALAWATWEAGVHK